MSLSEFSVKNPVLVNLLMVGLFLFGTISLLRMPTEINPKIDFKPPIWEENLKEEDLSELLHLAYKKFYIRPGYIIKNMLKVKSVSELNRKLKAGLKVLKL